MNNPITPRRLLWPLAQASVILLMGPVILSLGGNEDLTFAAAVASLRFTGPLAVVVLCGQFLLRWTGPGEERLW
ncbi:MAG TPA: hypothetical protein VK929_01465 [Longimicrobiales bacterium]|nr:hypothetical protein [Longimicrobiales bacterium]